MASVTWMNWHGRRQVASEQPDDPVGVPVEHSQALVDISQCEWLLSRSAAAIDLFAVDGEPGLSQSARVALRIEDKEVLIVDREADHPTSQLHGIGDPGVTRQPVELEQFSNQTSDLAVGVVGTEDHLDHVSNCSFDQLEEFGGR